MIIFGPYSHNTYVFSELELKMTACGNQSRIKEYVKSYMLKNM